MGISLGSVKKTVFGSPPLCRLGHNRCLLLSVPDKRAFINGWWPTWCLSWWFPFFPSALRLGNPHKHSRIPVRSLIVRINLSFLNRAHALRGESVAFRCLINDTYRVSLFPPETKEFWWGQSIEEYFGDERFWFPETWFNWNTSKAKQKKKCPVSLPVL